MKTNNRITVVGSIDELYGLVENVSRWPEIVENVGDVKILGMENDRKTVEMATRGKYVSLKITCVQEADPLERRVRFKYTGGVMDGVESEWNFGGVKLNHKGLVQVDVMHDFKDLSPTRVYLLNRLFLQKHTELMLQRLKEVAEAGFLAKVLLLGEDFFNEKMDWAAAAALENVPVVVKVY